MHRIALALVAACLASPALAEPGEKPQQEVRLDLDGDGRLDLARIVESGPRDAELHIYFGIGDATPDAARKADVIKKEIASNVLVGLEARRGRSLIVTDSCGGCTQSAVTSLTIVHRGGKLIVAGLDIDWEFRDESGRCTINFLTGQGERSTPWNGRPRPIRKKFEAVPLEKWDFYEGQGYCSPTR